MTYRAPINDILLALNHGAGLKAAVQAGHYGDFDGDITAAVLEEAGKFAAGDKTYVDEARTVLEQIRAERAAVAR